jgi:surface antigen
MKHLAGPCLGRGRLAIAAFALSGVLLLHPDPASAQGCGGGVLSTSKGNLIGSAVGGAAGGLLGNQFGSGSGKGVMTGLGVVGGALAGGYVGRSAEGCDHPPQAAAQPQPAAAPQQAVRRVSNRTAATAPAQAAQASESRACRSVLSQAVIDGREQQVEGIVCLDPDGVWRTASGPAAERAATADLVFRTQQRLHDQGFYVRDNIDGQWGPATSTALRNFQRANGLGANGQLDAPTRTALGLDTTPVAAAPAVQGGGEPVQAGVAQPGAAPVPVPPVVPAAAPAAAPVPVTAGISAQ